MEQQQQNFDAHATLATIRQDRATRRHRNTWGKSKLVPQRAELVKLKKAGGSLGDLVHWLKSEKRLTVDKSTVARFLAKLPEMAVNA